MSKHQAQIFLEIQDTGPAEIENGKLEQKLNEKEKYGRFSKFNIEEAIQSYQEIMRDELYL